MSNIHPPERTHKPTEIVFDKKGRFSIEEKRTWVGRLIQWITGKKVFGALDQNVVQKLVRSVVQFPNTSEVEKLREALQDQRISGTVAPGAEAVCHVFLGCFRDVSDAANTDRDLEALDKWNAELYVALTERDARDPKLLMDFFRSSAFCDTLGTIYERFMSATDEIKKAEALDKIAQLLAQIRYGSELEAGEKLSNAYLKNFQHFFSILLSMEPAGGGRVDFFKKIFEYTKKDSSMTLDEIIKDGLTHRPNVEKEWQELIKEDPQGQLNIDIPRYLEGDYSLEVDGRKIETVKLDSESTYSDWLFDQLQLKDKFGIEKNDPYYSKIAALFHQGGTKTFGDMYIALTGKYTESVIAKGGRKECKIKTENDHVVIEKTVSYPTGDREIKITGAITLYKDHPPQDDYLMTCTMVKDQQILERWIQDLQDTQSNDLEGLRDQSSFFTSEPFYEMVRGMIARSREDTAMRETLAQFLGYRMCLLDRYEGAKFEIDVQPNNAAMFRHLLSCTGTIGDKPVDDVLSEYICIAKEERDSTHVQGLTGTDLTVDINVAEEETLLRGTKFPVDAEGNITEESLKRLQDAFEGDVGRKFGEKIIFRVQGEDVKEGSTSGTWREFFSKKLGVEENDPLLLRTMVFFQQGGEEIIFSPPVYLTSGIEKQAVIPRPDHFQYEVTKTDYGIEIRAVIWLRPFYSDKEEYDEKMHLRCERRIVLCEKENSSSETINVRWQIQDKQFDDEP